MLGRADDLSDFVRRGESEGWIEVWLATGIPGKHMSVSRLLHRKDNSSEWKIDGAHGTHLISRSAASPEPLLHSAGRPRQLEPSLGIRVRDSGIEGGGASKERGRQGRSLSRHHMYHLP